MRVELCNEASQNETVYNRFATECEAGKPTARSIFTAMEKIRNVLIGVLYSLVQLLGENARRPGAAIRPGFPGISAGCFDPGSSRRRDRRSRCLKGAGRMDPARPGR